MIVLAQLLLFIKAYYQRHSRKVEILSKFSGLQLVYQLANVLFGLLVLRVLSIEEYAKYSLVFGFQSLISVLVDVGFSGVTLNRISQQMRDKVVVGEYISAAVYFRKRISLVLLPISLAFFIAIALKYDWTVLEQTFLFIPIALIIGYHSWTGYYGPLLLLHERIGQYYKPQILGPLGKIISIIGLVRFECINSVAVMWLNALAVVYNAFYFKIKSKRFYVATKNVDPNRKDEVKKILLPIIPTIIFFAFQGQISLFLISIFGSVTGLAQVSALGRIGQLFFFVSVLNSIVIVPYLAKLGDEDFEKRFGHVSLFVLIVASFISAFGFAFPDLIMSILGDRYNGLAAETSFVILGAAFNYIAGSFYSILLMKGWMSYRYSIINIGVTIMLQIVLIVSMDLSEAMGVVLFGVITALAGCIVNFVTCMMGLSQVANKENVIESIL